MRPKSIACLLALAPPFCLVVAWLTYRFDL